jgi:hypothetical protein
MFLVAQIFERKRFLEYFILKMYEHDSRNAGLIHQSDNILSSDISPQEEPCLLVSLLSLCFVILRVVLHVPTLGKVVNKS